MPSFEQRSYQKEIIDLRPLTKDEVSDTYRLIGYVNRFLGGEKAVLSHLEFFSRKWSPGETVTLLDAGCGDAGIPVAIARWAGKKGFRIKIAALDICPETLALARKKLGGQYPEIELVRGSAFDLPAADGGFDYVTASMFFHHLSEEEILSVLGRFDRIARRGIIINDLLRRRFAYWGIKLAGWASRNSVFGHDAPLSVLRGFKKHEAEELIRRSGLSYLKYYPHYAHRFAIAGEK